MYRDCQSILGLYTKEIGQDTAPLDKFDIYITVEPLLKDTTEIRTLCIKDTNWLCPKHALNLPLK